MNFDTFILGGYGQFVWPAFIITFSFFYILYLKTQKEFKRQEKIYSKEFNQIKNLNPSKEKISKGTISVSVIS